MPGKKLLVADDSLTIQKVIRLALSNEGYEIQAVSDGNDAIQQISLFRPDVVLIDVSLPGKSAFEVKRETNQHDDLEEIRFVLMSSAFESVDEAQSQEVNFHGSLTKPFDPAHLRQVLTDVLAQVTAKRMEKTSLLKSPSSEGPFSIPSLPRPPENLTVFPPPPLDEFKTNEWSEPVIPQDMPVFPPSSAEEPLQDLWEPNLEPSSSSIDSLPPPPMPQTPHKPIKGPTLPSDYEPLEDDNDIKKLADSTLRISGLDDFQWSVNEPSIREPSLKPLPGMMDRGSTSFQFDSSTPPEFEPTGIINTEDFPSQMDSPSKPLMESAPIAPPPMNLQPPKFEPTPPREAPVSEAQIEMIIQQQVAETLEKMAQKLLPELAERIIKQEIHRMLSE